MLAAIAMLHAQLLPIAILGLRQSICHTASHA
jgi:hypothetical protein